MDFQMDKLDCEHTFRMPEILKNRIRKLTNGQITRLNERLLVEAASFIHEEEFNPERYLNSEYRD